jgi:hypothetical protein
MEDQEPLVVILVATEAAADLCPIVARNLEAHGMDYEVLCTCLHLYEKVRTHKLKRVALAPYPRDAPETAPAPELLWQVPHHTEREHVMVLCVPTLFDMSPQLIFDAMPMSIGFARIGDTVGKPLQIGYAIDVPPVFIYRRSSQDIWRMETWLKDTSYRAHTSRLLRFSCVYPILGLYFCCAGSNERVGVDSVGLPTLNGYAVPGNVYAFL